MAEPIWEWQVWGKVKSDQIWYTEDLEVADNDFAIRLLKLKMAIKNSKELDRTEFTT